MSLTVNIGSRSSHVDRWLHLPSSACLLGEYQSVKVYARLRAMKGLASLWICEPSGIGINLLGGVHGGRHPRLLP